ncbi:hypothetical protein BGY98DRAFT_1188925 [Russula aff. rugulosa BPL654]|nr:hypothetical protein BGY98DRAFT_1188925 [Russula aff. rugulosa BPL654]
MVVKMTNWKDLVMRDGFIKAFANKCRNSGMEVGNEPPHILPTDQLPPVKNDHNRRKALDNIAKTIE